MIENGSLTAAPSAKKHCSCFLSYAHKNSGDVERLREDLQPLLKGCREFQFGEWMDRHILPGERWRAEIGAALKSAHFGMLLVSPEFLASDFITRNELPPLLKLPMVVPVALHTIPFDGSLDLKGLEDRQVFRDSKGRAFDACKGPQGRRQFALELFQQMIALLRKNRCL